jgi:two-component system CheB/CheR fusion protein
VNGAESPTIIQADGVRFEQMLWNLVRNALKFTAPGGRVALSLSRASGWICVAVADSGQGIASDYLPKVFDMFSQAEGGGRRYHGGLGIGLSLVKQLAEMHGGRVEVESGGLGKGACFRLLLPESALAADIGMSPPFPDSSILRNKRILHVDDSLEALEAFRGLLEMGGARVRAESSAEATLLASAEHDFDLIFSDIGMPTMSGYEFMTAVRKSDRNTTTPAIALTGIGRGQDAAQAVAAGFHAHLGKPVALTALLEAIDRIQIERPIFCGLLIRSLVASRKQRPFWMPAMPAIGSWRRVSAAEQASLRQAVELLLSHGHA